MSNKSKIKKIFSFVMLFILLSQIIVVTSAKKKSNTIFLTAPTNLVAESVGENSVTLKWVASCCAKGIASYLIYNNSVNIAPNNATSHTETGLTPSITYNYKDNSRNISSSSNTISVATSTPPQTSNSKIIAGYYASWAAYSGYTPLNIPAAKLTHINYAFAKVGDDLKIALGDPSVDITNFTKLNKLKASYPHLKTLISIGGWSYSDKFSDAALTDSSRTAFADSVIAFIKQYNFDGVDIDWEYPVSGGLPTNNYRPADKTNFTLLLKKLREKLDTQGAADGKKYLLSFAGGSGNTYIMKVELSPISGYVDYAILMAYDLHGPWDTYTGFNAALYTPSETSPQYKLSADSCVKSWISAGFPSSKIVLGVPFYGYIYSGVANSNNGLYKTFTNSASIAYDKIVSDYLSNST